MDYKKLSEVGVQKVTDSTKKEKILKALRERRAAKKIQDSRNHKKKLNDRRKKRIKDSSNKSIFEKLLARLKGLDLSVAKDWEYDYDGLYHTISCEVDVPEDIDEYDVDEYVSLDWMEPVKEVVKEFKDKYKVDLDLDNDYEYVSISLEDDDDILDNQNSLNQEEIKSKFEGLGFEVISTSKDGGDVLVEVKDDEDILDITMNDDAITDWFKDEIGIDVVFDGDKENGIIDIFRVSM